MLSIKKLFHSVYLVIRLGFFVHPTYTHVNTHAHTQNTHMESL